jgi:hypothetical protein
VISRQLATPTRATLLQQPRKPDNEPTASCRPDKTGANAMGIGGGELHELPLLR